MKKLFFTALYAAAAATLLFTPPVLAQDFVSGQAADAVVGKLDFTSSTPSTPTPTNTGNVASVVIDSASGKVFVCDFGNNRVLRFGSVADAISGVDAEIAFGQPDLITGTSNTGGLSATSLSSPIALHIDSAGRLWVADAGNHRILRYDDATEDSPTLATRTADGVLGQTDLTSGTTGTTASTLSTPRALWLEPNGSLWVADGSNHRVLRFNAAASLPDGAAASVVFGQPDFTSNASGLSQAMFNVPYGLVVDDAGRLFVSDSSNHRVLAFNSASIAGSNGLGASSVLGQPDFTTGSSGTTGQKFFFPALLNLSPQGRLFVPDFGNNRVVWFDDAAAKPNGAPADGVLGQPGFTTATAATTATGMTSPVATFLDDSGRLWVSDFNNNRALRFSPIAAPAATPTPTVDSTKPELSIRGRKSIETLRKRVVVRGTASDASDLEVKARGAKVAKTKIKGNGTFKVVLRVTKDNGRAVVKIRAVDNVGLKSKFSKLRILRR